MFGVDWGNPETFWLNATNLMLGVVTLACAGALIYGLAGDLLAKARQRLTVAGLDRELKDLHSYDLPELGLTMADGGEPVDDQPKKKAQSARGEQK
jgi:hypothetical protein